MEPFSIALGVISLFTTTAGVLTFLASSVEKFDEKIKTWKKYQSRLRFYSHQIMTQKEKLERWEAELATHKRTHNQINFTLWRNAAFETQVKELKDALADLDEYCKNRFTSMHPKAPADSSALDVLTQAFDERQSFSEWMERLY
ncbi:hypothetical protein EJ04DRAFT_526299 [Polyplosphaeria fusca]|uniref:Uncharacterized protein n=1 Tax=Polyplosphaeria fusca TaxID=682080 RepID=A0A9P4UWM4_9PLEO|nr:hypothetical protein EJ04DRAFT_526299 [Polyplosphaeria fusca]